MTLKFTEFNDFHKAANGNVRTNHPDVHIYRFSDIGKNVVKNMPVFTTSFYQIGLMRKGNFQMSVSGSEYKLNNLCAVVLFKPGQLIQFQADTDWEGYVVLFKENFLSIKQGNSLSLKHFPLLDPTTESFLFISEENFFALEKIYLRLLEEYQRPVLNSISIIEHYIHILFYEVDRLNKFTYRKEEPQLITKKAVINSEFKILVTEHLRQTKSVADYADMLNVTPKYLIEAVKEHSSFTPKDYINQQIMTEAKTLLKLTDLPIHDISQEYNFTDQAHFSRFFTAKEKVTPLNYRKQSKKR